jgi:hypothetical protein
MSFFRAGPSSTPTPSHDCPSPFGVIPRIWPLRGLGQSGGCRRPSGSASFHPARQIFHPRDPFRSTAAGFFLPPEMLPVLREIVELGAVCVRDGKILDFALPADNLYTPSRWAPTLRAAGWMAQHGRLNDGEYFVCLFDGWRELSRYVPPRRRTYVPWERLDPSRYKGRGVAGEPRFLHDPDRPDVYPRLCRPVLAYARHRGDPCVVLLPDPEFVATQGYAPLTSQLPRGAAAPLPSERMAAAPEVAVAAEGGGAGRSPKAAPLYWRGSPNWDPETLGRYSPGLREAVVAAAAGRGAEMDVRFVRPGERFGIAEQVAASPLQLDLDGMVGAWSGRFWKLLSPAVVPVRPHTPWEQWYEAQLRPWEHYVPVLEEGETGDPGEFLGESRFYEDYDIATPSAEALLRARRWCLDHPERCDAIAEAGSHLARAVLEELRSLLHKGSLW